MEALRGIELEGNSHAADLLLAEIYIYKGEFARATRLLNKLNIADPQNQNVRKLMDIAAKLPLESAAKIEEPPKPELPVNGSPVTCGKRIVSNRLTGGEQI